MTPSSQAVPPAGRLTDTAAIFAVVLVCAFALAVGVAWVNVGDPFVRHDDFPAVFGEEADYYGKTLSEGRWLNYWWVARPVLWSTQVNFVLYLLGWSIFSAGFATHAFGRNAGPFFGARVLLAALIVLTPQAFNIAQWFNTVVIGVWVLAGYALVCVFAPRRVAIGALLIFSPFAFSAYNTYPFYMLAMLMCRFDLDRSWRDYFLVLSVFALAFALGLLMAYSLNWTYHGVFGVRIEEWRQPNYITNLSDLIGNLDVLVTFLGNLVRNFGLGNIGLGYPLFMLAMLSLLVLMRRDMMLLVYTVSPILLGMGLLASYVLVTGVFLPVRATVFVWIVLSFSLVASVRIVGTSPIRQWIGFGVLATIVVLLGLRFDDRYRILQIWQGSTADLAARIPVDTGRIVIYGNPASYKGAREVGLQTVEGLSYRIRYLTGKPAVMCISAKVDCSAETPPFDPRPGYGSLLIETTGGVTYIRLPAQDNPP